MTQARRDRLYQARRAGLVKRLEGDGWALQRAGELVAEWEADADTRGLELLSPDRWGEAYAWIVERHPRKRSG